MPGPERPPDDRVPTSRLERKRLDRQDQAELDKLDIIFERIKRAVPPAPYVLSTPSLHPYTHYSRHESTAWMVGRLFQPDEEHLQYRTFHYREPYQDCFTLQPGEEDEPEVERPRSQTSGTSQQAPKKKISLSAYKSKQANGVITPGAKKTSPNMLPTKPPPVQTNGIKAADKQLPTTQDKDETRSQKRPATEPLAPEKPEKRIKENRPVVPPQQKTESTDFKMNIDTTGPSNATPHGLPPMLSPVDEPLNNPYGLPAILSPTLPSNIQAELDRIETKRKRAESDASNSSSSQLLSIPETKPPRREEGAKTTPRVRAVSTNGNTPSSVTDNRVDRVDPSTPSLLVKLKYGKKKGDIVTQLLRLPPNRKTAALNEKRERQENAKEKEQRPVKAQGKVVDGVAAKRKEVAKITSRRPDNVTPNVKVANTAKVAEKRPRTEDDNSLAVAAKRPRAQTLEGPRTPSQQTSTSPTRLHTKSSAQRGQGQYTTPRKDHKAVSMLRGNSTEGYDSTPGRSGATPAGSKHMDSKAPSTSAPLNAKKQADIQSLSQISMKLNQMGRSLKHESQKAFLEKGSKATKEDLKRAAVMSLECILSYMAAYHAQDFSLNLRGRPGEVEGTWKTLLPLCVSYTVRTKDFPHLDGLQSYLSASISAGICTYVSPRAHRPKAHDPPHNTPELTKQNALPTENFSLMADHYQKLFRFTNDARMTLPVDEIIKLFPKTWSGRELNARLAKEPEKVNGVNLSGPYFLPIALDTTPIQAVRFGLKLLGEYCERERLDYTLRVNLKKPE
ncbi:hypothetical protein K504DRAFT_375879 [Pleomassaria siparia CBS 279.74]|uniref:Ell binding protein Ebp1 C-terminal domain-containing protein n=1 Tax=Pleomassaria siparia CBS 279.74 TaxID=1314801 RepID=A0A6G1KDX0_9PLEO|nr:hypothetical protein K504DRAFT_375879 [Pleomassaria siparia CBS 279.74]